MGFSPTSMPEGFQRASGKPFGAPVGAVPLSRVGIDAPTPARLVGLPPRGGEVLSFEAKESTKESTRHGDSRGGPRRFALRPSPALRLCLATRFMAFGHFWR